MQLGSKESLSEDLFLSETLYLGMQIEDDDELSPRAGLFSVPTAFYAQKATVAESLADGLVITPDQILDGGITTAKISSGAVGSTQLSSTGVTAGTYGSANQVAQITVDSKGRITSATNINLTASGSGDLTGLIAGTGLTGGGDSGDITLNVNVGTGANQIVQLDGSAKLPAVDGSLLTNITPANNSVTSGKIADGTIGNADISDTAAIEDSKLATITTPGKVDASSIVGSFGSMSIEGGTIDNAVIGGTTAAAGTFTSVVIDAATQD